MKKYFKRILFIILFVSSFISNSQNIYVIRSYGEIYSYNTENQSTILIEDFGTSADGQLRDIAYSTTGELYGVNQVSIFHLDPNSGNVTNLIDLEPGVHASLTCSDSGVLYTLNNNNYNLYAFDIQNEILSIVANLGSQSHDLTFYKGSIIFTTPPYVKSYNLTTREINNIFCSEDTFFYGITNLYTDCNNQRLFAVSPSFQNGYIRNRVWELDIDLGTASIVNDNLLGEFEFPSPSGGIERIDGLASLNEGFAQNCNFDFEDIQGECLLSLMEFQGTTKIKVFPNPVYDYLNIQYDGTIDKINIYSLSGKMIQNYNDPKSNLDLGHIPEGIYFLEISEEDKISIIKIIKK